MPPSVASQASKSADCIYPQSSVVLQVDEMATLRHHINEFGIELAGVGAVDELAQR